VPGSDSDETPSLPSHLEWGSHRDFSEDDCSDARSVLSRQKKPASISTSGNENVHLIAELPLPPTNELQILTDHALDNSKKSNVGPKT
jgi:hypothetical protein